MEYIGFGKDDVEYDEEPEDDLRETETVPEERKKSTERRVLSTGNVVSLPGVNCGKMIVYRPVSYEDTQNIIDNLKGRKPVIVNMEQIEVETAQRILDFMSGACYAVDGRLYKVSARIFLVAPANYDIIGSSTASGSDADVLLQSVPDCGGVRPSARSDALTPYEQVYLSDGSAMPHRLIRRTVYGM